MTLVLKALGFSHLDISDFGNSLLPKSPFTEYPFYSEYNRKNVGMRGRLG